MWIRILGSAVVVFAFVSQLITFAMFGTDFCEENDCSLGWGGVFSIIAAVLYLISAVTIWKIPEPREVAAATAGAADNSIQVNETELSDGTMVMEKMTINSDGTQTIEKTIIKSRLTLEVELRSLGIVLEIRQLMTEMPLRKRKFRIFS
jgi:hypothetical protein